MTLANLGMARSARRDSSPVAAWPGRAFAAALPFVLILAWSATVRLPFYGTATGDEFFFSVVAREWLHGSLPYVSTFDIKPPGLFFIYAVAQALFGDSYATIKGMEIVAVAAAASLLYAMLRSSGLSRPVVTRSSANQGRRVSWRGTISDFCGMRRADFTGLRAIWPLTARFGVANARP